MAITCPQCGAEYDVTLFTFGRRIRCDCGSWVDLAVGHQQTGEDAEQLSQQESATNGRQQPMNVTNRYRSGGRRLTRVGIVSPRWGNNRVGGRSAGRAGTRWRVFPAAVGALLGGVLGGNVIRTVGWCMIAGALVGGIAAIVVTRIGKAAIYGVPLGTILGLIVGLVVEEARRKPSQ